MAKSFTRNFAPNDFKKRAVESKPRERIEEAGTASVASAAELLAIIIKNMPFAWYKRI